ncbi:MAG: hypothetical protein JNM58_02545 [Xanthomonadaceae bacterium]|nr:hypothetical protein [Xanthomonadaceae bacterium]
MSAFPGLHLFESDGHSRVLVLGATHLECELLPVLHDALRRMGRVQRLDVIAYCRGGEVAVARRIGLLLHRFAERVRFIVPHHCQSAGTVMALAAHEIVAGPLAMFSPIDPHLAGTDASGEAAAMSALDIRMFPKLAQDWFGLDETAARERALPLLCESIAPAALTAFYRSTLAVRQIGEELLALHMPEASQDARSTIVETLLFGFHAHDYTLTGEDLRAIGLNVQGDPALEDAAWTIVAELRTRMGPETRKANPRGWCDALVATRDGGFVRTRQQDMLPGDWHAFDVAS